MITLSDVYSQFLLYIKPDEDEISLAVQICENELDYVMKRLRKDVRHDDKRVSRTAAGLAYYDYCLMKLANSDDPEYFKAGDVTVRNEISDRLKIAEKVKDTALENAGDIFEDTAFGAWNVC